jgi:beta-1,2-mannosidase
MDDSVYVLYRAEDSSGQMHVGGHTSRLGLAASADGVHFVKYQAPVLFPANDNQKRREWKGGCEDPRLVRTCEGTFVLTYTQYNRLIPRLGVATSVDLKHWVKHGSAFKGRPLWMNIPSKSAAIICEIVNGELRAAKINGRYWMYVGERKLRLASSRDLLHWRPGKVVYRPRPGYYDSQLTEAGPPAVITIAGVVLLYNGKNSSTQGDTTIAPGTYAVGQLLFNKNDFGHLLHVTEKPCFEPTENFERTGQYAAGTTFAEGLVLFKGKWYMYYGCADSLVGVAVADK